MSLKPVGLGGIDLNKWGSNEIVHLRDCCNEALTSRQMDHGVSQPTTPTRFKPPATPGYDPTMRAVLGLLFNATDSLDRRKMFEAITDESRRRKMAALLQSLAADLLATSVSTDVLDPARTPAS